MRGITLVPVAVLPFLVGLSLVVGATGVEGCVATSADPATINEVTLPTALIGRTFYIEERGVVSPFNTSPPIPGSGWLFGDGTWVYEESNQMVGLQRGWCGIDARGADCTLGDWFPPGCDQNPDWQPTDGTLPCLIMDDDPINDETCGSGPDTVIV